MKIDLTVNNITYQAFPRAWLQSLAAKQIDDLSWPQRRFHCPVSVADSTDIVPMTQQEIQSAASIPNTACLHLGVDALKKVSSDKRFHKFYMFTGFGAVDEDGFAALARDNDFWISNGHWTTPLPGFKTPVCTIV
ncbi:hypothetical protein BGW42_007250 [Actinomortierella wolfii]|nr:hypothetical protein BGW42_007250 [Actinomortierella wolfii]